MKAICIKATDTLTKDKVYEIHHEYENQIEVLNDRRWYKYYSKDMFYIINKKIHI